MRRKLVLIGNGMAGVRCIEEILKLDREAFEITIFGSEPHPNYNRILLSEVLQGDTRLDDITLNSWEWYERNGIRLFVGETVTEVDIKRRLVRTDRGRVVEYDELIFATGSNPFILPVPGADLPGVTAFRDIQDCERMIEYAKTYKKAAVIGGGLLGLEAARGLLHLGMDVDVIHIFDYLMERQLDPTASKLLQRELEKQGMNVLLRKETAELFGNGRVEGVRFKDGTSIAADLVVMAVGIRPNVDLARRSGIEVNRGIVVNDYLETSVPHIYAVGECAEHRGVVYGLVAPLYEQGKVLAEAICGRKGKPYEGSVVATQLKVSGVDVFSAGEFMDGEGTESIKLYDEARSVYKKVVVRQGKVVGAVLFGDTSEGRKLFDMIQRGDSVEALSLSLFAPAALGGKGSLAAAMADTDVVCGCNGVTKGAICQAIAEHGLKTVAEVRDYTNASRSCGRCKGLVAELLEHMLGEEANRYAVKEMICGCTDLSREEVLEAIEQRRLMTVKEVMSVLGWKNEEGCSKCRPALNYYLGMLYPGEYDEEAESLFVNERLHANIQADGTYSVVPRIYGGVTTAEQLRNIADVAEKYNVPMIKITGGQRIDLLGVKKEDLPRIWADLGMPSGYAYAKALRTVKTCVGKQFCRFGTQDSTGLGIRMEQTFERLKTPHKVKMAVSACPRNCAESGIKDVGVVGVEGGWEIYVGGNGGTHLRAADLLCTVKTEDEVIEMTGAFLQYYRESAHYLERTSKWVERVGLEHIREVLFDVETRRALLERLHKALSATTDPWRDIVENERVQQLLFRDIGDKEPVPVE